MKRIPNAVAFAVFIGLAVTVTSVLTAPAGRHSVVLLGYLIATLIVALLVAVGIWLRSKLRRDRPST